MFPIRLDGANATRTAISKRAFYVRIVASTRSVLHSDALRVVTPFPLAEWGFTIAGVFSPRRAQERGSE